MRHRTFTAGRATFWRHRFLQIAREMDAAASPARPGAARLGLRLRPAQGATPRVRARAPGLATA
jgi:hypothetical protein